MEVAYEALDTGLYHRGNYSGDETLYTIIIGRNNLSFNDTNVTNFQSYFYRVSAINNFGEGPRSDKVEATPKTPPVVTTEEKNDDEPNWGQIRCGLFGIILILIIVALIVKLIFIIRSRERGI